MRYRNVFFRAQSNLVLVTPERIFNKRCATSFFATRIGGNGALAGNSRALVDIELLRSVGEWLGDGRPPGKHAMLDAPLRPFPNAILSRPKTGFGIPVREWLLVQSANGSRERGLRGWAKVVYSQFVM